MAADYSLLFKNAIGSGIGQSGILPSGSQGDFGDFGKSILSQALNLGIGMLLSGINAAEEAEEDVRNGEKAVETIDEAKQKSADKYQRKMNEIIDVINDNAKKLEENLEKIQDHEQQKQQLEDEYKAIQEKLKNQQNIINDPNASKDEKKKAMDAISNVNIELLALDSRIQGLQKNIDWLNSLTKDIRIQNEDLNAESEAVTVEGQEEQQVYNTQLQQQVTENTKVAAAAAQNTATAVQAESQIAALEGAKAGSTLLGPIGSIVGNAATEAEIQQLRIVADSNRQAASTRTSGTGRISQYIVGSMQGITENIGTIKSLGSCVLRTVEDSESVGNDYYDVSNALGSWLDSAPQIQEESGNIKIALDQTNAQMQQAGTNDNNDNKDNKGKKEDASNVRFNYNPKFDVYEKV